MMMQLAKARLRKKGLDTDDLADIEKEMRKNLGLSKKEVDDSFASREMDASV